MIKILIKISIIFLNLFFFAFSLFICFKPPSHTTEKNSNDRLNLIIISSDALRSDYLSCYGYKFKTTPNIDEFSRNAYLFENTYTVGSRTTIALGSLHRGVYPDIIQFSIYPYTEGKVIHNLGYKFKKGFNKNYTAVIDKDIHPTLAEILAKNKYATGSFIDAGISDYFTPGHGYQKGFEHVFIYKYDKKSKPGGEIIREQLEQFIEDNISKQRPFYAWIHFRDTHTPYLTWKLGKSFSDGMVGKYEGGVSYFDFQFSQLFKSLKKNNILDNTIIAITSDHGEELYERGMLGHGNTVFNEQVKIPLIIKIPNMGRGRTEIPASLVDVIPTILPYLNYHHYFFGSIHKDFPFLDGIDLIPFFVEYDNNVLLQSYSTRVVFIETFNFWKGKPWRTVDLIGLTNNSYKYVFNKLNKKEYLFDLFSDQKERRNLLLKKNSKKYYKITDNFRVFYKRFLKRHKEKNYVLKN
jgi:arylsulfatase A-like enzyme